MSTPSCDRCATHQKYLCRLISGIMDSVEEYFTTILQYCGGLSETYCIRFVNLRRCGSKYSVVAYLHSCECKHPFLQPCGQAGIQSIKTWIKTKKLNTKSRSSHRNNIIIYGIYCRIMIFFKVETILRIVALHQLLFVKQTF